MNISESEKGIFLDEMTFEEAIRHNGEFLALTKSAGYQLLSRNWWEEHDNDKDEVFSSDEGIPFYSNEILNFWSLPRI